MGQFSYSSRESVLQALDTADTSRSGAQVDRLLRAASQSVEALTHRRFYPEWATKYFGWPDEQHGTAYRLWLDEVQLLSVSQLVSGGVALADYYLEPQRYGPPYSHLELNRAVGNANFGGGGTSSQRDIAITGVWGSCDDLTPAGSLSAAVAADATTLTVTDSSAIGILSTLKIGQEYLQVTGRSMVTTGQTITVGLVERNNDVILTVADASSFRPGEMIRVDAERMRVTDADATTVHVERACDGTPLAAHAIGATVRAGRWLYVDRAQQGTTAAVHDSGAPVSLHTPPADVVTLTIEETIFAYQNEQSGMARAVGQGVSQQVVTHFSLTDQRAAVWSRHGRIRKRAI